MISNLPVVAAILAVVVAVLRADQPRAHEVRRGLLLWLLLIFVALALWLP